MEACTHGMKIGLHGKGFAELQDLRVVCGILKDSHVQEFEMSIET